MPSVLRDQRKCHRGRAFAPDRRSSASAMLEVFGTHTWVSSSLVRSAGLRHCPRRNHFRKIMPHKLAPFFPQLTLHESGSCRGSFWQASHLEALVVGYYAAHQTLFQCTFRISPRDKLHLYAGTNGCNWPGEQPSSRMPEHRSIRRKITPTKWLWI